MAAVSVSRSAEQLHEHGVRLDGKNVSSWPCGNCGSKGKKAEVGAYVPNNIARPDQLSGEPQQDRIDTI
jgi:hypothetical protein